MGRRPLFAVALCLAAASVCTAGIATNRFTISTEEKGRAAEFLAVRDGELTLGNSTFGTVSDTGDAADRWYIAGTKIKSSAGGGYLAYDPTGRTNRVFLTLEPGEGTDWYVSAGGRGPADEGKRGAIRAMSGPLQGWYLDVADGEDRQGVAATKSVSRRALVLSKNATRKLEAERIWEHK